jgi:diacylglycerol kinase (ATP)
MRARFILNPQARQGSVSLREAVGFFVEAGWTVDLLRTEYPGHAIELARCAATEGYDLVVACGGDGTLNEAVNGLAGSDTALGVLPLGTANVWAREIGLPLRLADAARALLDGEVHRVDLGYAEPLDGTAFGRGRYFLMMAGIGFDAEVARAVRPQEKRRWGMIAYVAAGIATALRFTGTRMTLQFDGQRMRRRVLLAVIGNTRLYGGLVEITHQALADDGMLDLCFFEGSGLLQKIEHVVRVLLRRHTASPRVCYFRAREVVVRSRQPVPVQLDGDTYGQTPMRFCAVPQALSVLVPRTYPRTLFSRQQEPTAVPAAVPGMPL